ncbi:transcriptional regulator [Leptospira wolffii]|uniref:Transcriptional regulator n=1 Tax=Leptospira wolffii TaxID=409998 RepID=A0A2M9Z7F9_9LEPT|nr:metalloregulator ArsR/SmtB family transcription factor [Leptospira wolffii]PJZ64371.1 transcriptional regulator [Leptospira wolffii]
MGITKTELFNKRQNRIASYAKALGHPARIAILESILKRKACICGDLVEELNLAQATVSQHLKALKDIGIIKGSIEGPSICYCINEKVWIEIREYFDLLLSQDPKTDISC